MKRLCYVHQSKVRGDCRLFIAVSTAVPLLIGCNYMLLDCRISFTHVMQYFFLLCYQEGDKIKARILSADISQQVLEVCEGALTL